MQYQALKERHRLERDQQHPNLSLRIHRALSWLNRAEQADDADGRFIFLWIAFNAAYATDIDEQRRLSEQETFKAFLKSSVRSTFRAASRGLSGLSSPEASVSCWITPLSSKASGTIKTARSARQSGKSASVTVSVLLSKRLPVATRQRCWGYCLIASIPCATNSSTAAPRGTVASTAINCVIAAAC